MVRQGWGWSDQEDGAVLVHNKYEGLLRRAIRECDKLNTEFAEGSDLFEWISDKIFSLNEAKCRGISGQVLEAMEFLHKNRVIHLDILHNNIVFASTDPYSLKIN